MSERGVSKRKYVKPELVMIPIDRQVALQLMSDPGGGVTPPLFGPLAPNPYERPFSDSPGGVSKEDVFGGHSPFPQEK